ncbi:MAG: enoyl-CoA hydratase/isomerase family protein [Comamonadaceae bacterium]|nr:MAG: enoyl-CoA hydratase/isomerase family protein [Comamonadaceae bacterium]
MNEKASSTNEGPAIPSVQAGQPVLVEQRGAVRHITLNRESRRNALNEELVRLLGDAIESAASEPSLRAIVITGAGDRAFCAGADLQKGIKGAAFDLDFSRPRHYLVELFRRMQACRLPIVARVNGHVMAGGFGLLCACDMAVAADDVLFGTPETKIGLIPMMILPVMQRVVPERKLLEMCITGEPMTASEALHSGILNYAVPRGDLDTRLDWLLARITDKSPTAIRIGKQAFHAMRDMAMSEALEYAQVMVPVMVSTQDGQEGLAAFQERRTPVWTGR